MQRHLTAIMAALYRSEINSSVSTFWDGGFTVKLGDEMNGFKAENNFRHDELDHAAEWLEREAIKQYPDSDFAKAA